MHVSARRAFFGFAAHSDVKLPTRPSQDAHSNATQSERHTAIGCRQSKSRWVPSGGLLANQMVAKLTEDERSTGKDWMKKAHHTGPAEMT